MDKDLNHAEAFSLVLNQASKTQLADTIHFYFDEASDQDIEILKTQANILREKYYGKKVFFRGLIEFSNHCKNDCYYCGIRKSNAHATRYRLTEEEIINCCKKGHVSGLRTFVLQSGEDNYFNDDRLCGVVYQIKNLFPDSALTLSVGERSFNSYKRLYDAGADRYLLRHETADEAHYAKLHPKDLSLINRKRCLYDLKWLGFQVGAGFMVGSPFQTYEALAEDLIFLRRLSPQMIGIGPFIPHRDTPFKDCPLPEAKKTLIMLSLIRIMLPKVLLPATTALGTADNLGREKGLKAGANVLMPNISPLSHRKDYALYDNKVCTKENEAGDLDRLIKQITLLGFIPDLSRGDHIDSHKKYPPA